MFAADASVGPNDKICSDSMKLLEPRLSDRQSILTGWDSVGKTVVIEIHTFILRKNPMINNTNNIAIYLCIDSPSKRALFAFMWHFGTQQ